jgi:hypothetical protein
MKAIKNICDLLKEKVQNDYNDEFRDLEFRESIVKYGQELWIGENLIEFNFVASKENSKIDNFRVDLHSLFIISMPNENSIERTNIKNLINKNLA